jgi:hypothetical protein
VFRLLSRRRAVMRGSAFSSAHGWPF